MTIAADDQPIERAATPKVLPRTDYRKAQSEYSTTVQKYGRDSAEAQVKRLEFWCVKTCSLIADMLEAHNLNEDQRQRIAITALVAGR